MASITIPGRTPRQVYHLQEVCAVKSNNGGNAGIDLIFSKHGTDKRVTILLDHHETYQIIEKLKS